MPSSIGSSTRPTPRIWKKWSMTQIESKPTSSASRTIRASVGPIASGPPGQVNELICRPTFIARRLAEEVHLRGHDQVLDAAVAAVEGGAADERERTTGGLAEDELRG